MPDDPPTNTTLESLALEDLQDLSVAIAELRALTENVQARYGQQLGSEMAEIMDRLDYLRLTVDAAMIDYDGAD
jgi:hypothetical protein